MWRGSAVKSFIKISAVNFALFLEANMRFCPMCARLSKGSVNNAADYV